MPSYAVALLEREFGSLANVRVAVLGAAYRGGVKETAFSGVFDVVSELNSRGAYVLVHDPLYTKAELAAFGWHPYEMGVEVDAAIIQADHEEYNDLSSSDLPGVRAVVNGRSAIKCQLRALQLGGGNHFDSDT